FIYNTPIAIAVIVSPGMANTRAGIHALLKAALFALEPPITPSTWPVPHFSGLRDTLRATAVEIHAAISALAPGSIPMNEPRALLRITTLRYPHTVEKTFFHSSTARVPDVSTSLPARRKDRKISGSANMPIRAGINDTPSSRSALPNVKRGSPDEYSMPTQEMIKPISKASPPLTGSLPATKMAQLKPRTLSQKNSNTLKFKATLASMGAANIRTAQPTTPPSIEHKAPTPRM